MSKAIIALIVIVVAVLLGKAFWEHRKQATDEATAPAQVQMRILPDDIEIVRKDSSRLMVRLIGRDDAQIEFERLTDQMRFTFDIAELDTATQRLVRSYPANGITPPEPVEPAEATDTESLHIKQLEEAIAKIDARLKELQIRYASTISSAEKRAIQNEAQKLNAERLTHAADIAKRTGVELERRRSAELRNKF